MRLHTETKERVVQDVIQWIEMTEKEVKIFNIEKTLHDNHIIPLNLSVKEYTAKYGNLVIEIRINNIQSIYSWLKIVDE